MMLMASAEAEFIANSIGLRLWRSHGETASLMTLL
jgi:hypothetical protein